MRVVDRQRLGSLVDLERARFTASHPRSRALFEDASHLFRRVPMTWMAMWSGGFPVYLDHATGNRVVDVDGHEYVDFALGDTGAMAGHDPAATVDAVVERVRTRGGITTMLPTADAEWVGAELNRRFGLPLASDPLLDEYLHLALLNRGILITPFHNMALMCPDTTPADVALQTEVFASVVDELFTRRLAASR